MLCYGCQVASKCAAVITYADDLTLISASHRPRDLRLIVKICEVELSWLDVHFSVKKSSVVRCGPRYSKICADVFLNGAPLCVCNSLKYLCISFDVKCKLKFSMASKKTKFFRVFNYIYGCVGATAACVILCHLLNMFCLTILLYGLNPILFVNLRVLQLKCNVAVYKVFFKL